LSLRRVQSLGAVLEQAAEQFLEIQPNASHRTHDQEG